jgi:hypothetical protein
VAEVTATCAGCERTFVARSKRAKWCSSTCRQRAARDGKASVANTEAEAGTGLAEHGLVKAVRAELEQAQKVDTFNGQLALQLATRLAAPNESESVALSKELRAVMDVALGKPAAAPESEPAPPVAVDDEVTKARRAREQKARQAARRA